MFCSKCGTQLPDSSRFCPKCGSPVVPISGGNNNFVLKQGYNRISTKNTTIGVKQVKLDIFSIIAIVIAGVMLLSMIVLPMFVLGYNGHHTNKYDVSLLGDNYMPQTTDREKINTASRIGFIFMLASLAMVIIFRLVKKPMFSLIASGANLGILLIYDLIVSSIWTAGGSSSTTYYANLAAGNILCILCAISLCVFAFLDFKKSRNALGSTTPGSINGPVIFR